MDHAEHDKFRDMTRRIRVGVALAKCSNFAHAAARAVPIKALLNLAPPPARQVAPTEIMKSRSTR
jgi:hypothetical protein